MNKSIMSTVLKSGEQKELMVQADSAAAAAGSSLLVANSSHKGEKS